MIIRSDYSKGAWKVAKKSNFNKYRDYLNRQGKVRPIAIQCITTGSPAATNLKGKTFPGRSAKQNAIAFNFQRSSKGKFRDPVIIDEKTGYTLLDQFKMVVGGYLTESFSSLRMAMKRAADILVDSIKANIMAGRGRFGEFEPCLPGVAERKKNSWGSTKVLISSGRMYESLIPRSLFLNRG